MEKRLPLHFHFTGRNDRSRNLPTRGRLPFMEMLLPDLQPDDCDPAITLCSTDARASGTSPTSSTYPQDTKSWT